MSRKLSRVVFFSSAALNLLLKPLLAIDGWQLNGALKLTIVCVAIIFHKCSIQLIAAKG